MTGIDNQRCHLMVCMMESWIVADWETLSHHFSKARVTLQNYPNIEIVPKAEINHIMETVSQHHYHKIHDGLRLLEKLDADVVQQKAPHCRRLFDTLNEIIASVP
jgi:hypothetical protein